MKHFVFLGLSEFLFLFMSLAHAETVLETYPGLQKFVSTERTSNVYFGFGLNPVNFVGSKIGFSASVFQVHYIKNKWDLELFNGSFGAAFGKQYGNEQFFLIRTAPKYRVVKNISVGPVLGMEFVHFPDVQAELYKNGNFTKPFDFSTVGAVYGLTISDVIEMGGAGKSSLLRISGTLMKENYSVVGTNNGWQYYYMANYLNGDSSPIAPSTVFLLELSYLF